jgi:hypothetical protein
MRDHLATTDVELEWVAERAAGCRYVVEVGVWLGRSLKVWADNMRGDGVAIGVDAWNPEVVGTPSMRDNLLRVGPEEALRRCRETLADHISAGHVQLVRLPAVEAAAKLHPGADLVYLDAATEEGETARQLAAYEALVKPGGLISGHHYLRRPGARAAIDARYGARVQSDGQIWWVAL